MSKVEELVFMVEMLPIDKQDMISDFIKKVYLEWDPDYTKVTEKEKKIIDDADARYEAGEFFTEKDIKWKF